MGRPKGKLSEYNYRTKEEKLKIVKEAIENCEIRETARKYNISSGMLSTWCERYRNHGEKGLESKINPRNPLVKYQFKKSLTKEEQLEYENMKLRIEVERLKKGYIVKGDGQIVVLDMEKFKNLK